MATTVKFDDGSGAFVSNCFPVRPVLRFGEPGEGAWLEAHRAEQRRRFKAVICPKPPRTYSRIRQERIAAEREQDDITPEPEIYDATGAILDGFFLMKHCCVEDPADLCSINIAGQGIVESRPEDFQLFDNVAYINAADNQLNLENFNRFNILRELEIPVNDITSIKLSHKMFRNLEMLDLSYNNLTKADVLELGYLRSLKVLYLSGNNLESLPENLAGFYVTKSGFKKRRFPKLEILCLDENSLNNYTAFAPLAGLKELKHLNLEKNEISAVPQLEPKTIKHDKLSAKNIYMGQHQEANIEQTASQSFEDRIVEESEMAVEKKEMADNKLEKVEPPVPQEIARFAIGEDLSQSEIMGERQAPADFDDHMVVNNKMTAGEDKEQQVVELEDGEVLTDSEDEMDGDEVPAIPFPQLRFLTLGHNYLTEEEDLLPIAAWPNLTQVLYHDNPLTNERSGDPPMLKKFLSDRLGIDLIRKKPVVAKPVKEFPPQRKSRQVTSIIPPVPKCDVDKLLMIEASKRQPAIAASPGLKTPLPPINKTPSPVNATDSLQEVQEEQEEIDNELKVTIETLEETEKEAAETEREAPHDEQGGDAFFMTQIDEPTAEKTSSKRSTNPYYAYQTTTNTSVAQIADEEKVKPRRKVQNLTEQQLKLFKGYEELLIEDEYEKDVHVPSDLHNTVKALHYALKHPIVNNHTMRLDTTQKPFLPYKRSDTGKHKRPETKAERISRAVEGVRHMNTVIESPLERALTDKDLHRKYPEAAKLLRDIQKKYANAQSAVTGESDEMRTALRKASSLNRRAHTEMLYMADKNTSMTDLAEQRPSTNL